MKGWLRSGQISVAMLALGALLSCSESNGTTADKTASGGSVQGGAGGSATAGTATGGNATGGVDTGGTAQGGMAGSASGASGTGGASGANGALGSACTDDTACAPDGLTCVPSDSTLVAMGGPPGGLCTTTCATDDDCTPYGDTARCLLGYCYEGCVASLNNTDKCHARDDFTCVPLSVTPVQGSACADRLECPNGQACFDTFCQIRVSACIPVCRRDEQCPAGRFCDNEQGVCLTQPPTGLDFGTPCDPSAATDQCRGVCVSVGDQVQNLTGFCSEYCQFREPCNYVNGTPLGFCSLPSVDAPDAVAGDLAFCAELCHCTADCTTPGLSCIEDTTLSSLGYEGVCATARPMDTVLDTCP